MILPETRGRALALAPGLAAVVLIGVALRFAALSHHSFFYDEAVSARIAQAPWLDILLGRARDRGNPPLYVLLLHPWTLVFGASDASVRALSAAAGAASIPLVHAVARRLTGERAALLAAAIFAIAPVQVYFAQEARTYALVTLLCLASMAFLLRAVEDPRRAGSWVGFGAATFLAIYAHYFALFVVVAQAGWLLATRGRERPVVLPALAALAGAGALYAVAWLPVLVAQARMEGNLGRATGTWYLHLLSTPLVFSVGTTLLWKDAVGPLRVAAAGLALAAFGGAALAGIWSLRRDRGPLALLLSWLLAPILLPLLVSVLLFPLFQVRYALPASPAAYVLVAAGLLQLGPRLRAATTSAIVAACALSLALYFTTPVKDDWRGAATWLAPRTAPGDVIAFDADIGETAYAHYAGPDDRRIRLLEPPGREGSVRYWGTSPRRETPHAVSERLPGAGRVWLVLSDPGSGTGGYYEALFRAEWRRVETRAFRGIEIAAYRRPEGGAR